MSKRISTILVLMTLAFVGLDSLRPLCAAEAGKTITVTDLAGRTVTLKTPINRIVLVRSRDVYELSLLLGNDLPKKLVAWGPDIKTADKDAYDNYVAKFPALKNLTEVGDIFKDAVNPEQILALNPDLVIMDIFMIERGYKCVGKLQEAGLPLVFFDGSGDPLQSPQRSLTLLGKILGKEVQAAKIVNYVNEQIDTVLARVKKLDKPMPKVYLEIGNGGPATFGSTYGAYGNPKVYSSWGDIMQRCRINDIADGIIQNMAPINPEYVLQADPEVIIISGAYWPAAGAMRLGYYAKPDEAQKLLAGFLARPGWNTISAVKNKRVYSLFHGFVMHIFDFAGLQGIVKYCYPAEFKDLDPEKNLMDFHKKFMPIPYGGTWILSLK